MPAKAKAPSYLLFVIFNEKDVSFSSSNTFLHYYPFFNFSEELSKAVRLLKNKMRIYFVLVSARLKSNYIELMFLDKESVLCNLLRTIRSFESGSGIISKKTKNPLVGIDTFIQKNTLCTIRARLFLP